MIQTKEFMDNVSQWADICLNDERIDLGLYEKYEVKRGLRDKNGNGVVAGLTKVSKIESNKVVDGVKVPCEGKLFYRGYNIYDLIGGVVRDNRYGFEEIAYLLLFGELPGDSQLTKFRESLAFSRTLPTNFVRDVVMKAPSRDMMISLSKSILTLASYDDKAWDISIPNVLRQSMMLISVMPMLAVYGYHAYNHYERDASMYIHRPDENLSTAENLLRLLRPDMKYSEVEAHVLDLALILHMEHGGGNNSTFTTHVVSSSGTDTYSVVSAALASLKGPKHGGANIRCSEMISAIEKEIGLKATDAQIKQVIKRILDKEFYDNTGLVYGLGHAVYTVSDPRADLLKTCCEKLAKQKKREDEYEFLTRFEKVAKETLAGNGKTLSNNVDFYSGFAYNMLQIPEDMYTPLFVCARMAGWLAHNIENKMYDGKIMRPAFKYVGEATPYKKREER